MNSIFIQIGNISIYWYSIFILIGIILGYFYAVKESKKFNISESKIIDLIFILIPLSILGARLYYVLFNLDYYIINPSEIFAIWNGGLAIHGGIIAGLIYLYYFAKKNKINFLLLTDITVVSLFIGQALGRWGNFMNSEAYGPITNIQTLENLYVPNFIIDGMFIDGFYRFPTFYFESIACIIGAIVIIILKNKTNIKLGMSTSIYLAWYGVVRFWIESLRTDSLMLSNFKIAQIVSIIMILIALVLAIYSNNKNIKYREAK